MNCPTCGTLNRDRANFCKNCGTLLVQTCPRCKNALPQPANFCDNCGLRLVDAWNWAWLQTSVAPGAGAEAEGSRSAEESRQRKEPTPPSKSTPPTPVPSSSRPAVMPPAAERGPLPRSAGGGETAAVTRGTHLQQYLPTELKAKLDAARVSGQMAGERKQVTVLFTDIVGSTALAEKLDPEEWGEIVAGAHRLVSQVIYRYEGTIAQLLGDGVLAFFGAPITHEDDPVRAVNAALDILKQIHLYRDELRAARRVPDFQMRIGLNTGLVVVGNIGSDLHMEYLAVGDAINLAARMEQTALPDTVQIAQETYKYVKPWFEFEDLGGIEVKGKNEPVVAYRVVGRKELAGSTRGIEGLHAEMVGRDIEMQTLREIMADLKQGVGRIVCVLGDAGLGKSRLVYETRQVFRQLIGEGGQWHETIILSYESNQAYGLFQRLIRRVTGLGYDDPLPIARDKLSTILQGVSEERRPRAMQLLEALFGLESQSDAPLPEGEAFKRELVEILKEWWRADFAGQPTVLAFDDTHWSDAASVEMLRPLLALTEEIPLVLLFALRTERQAPAWQIKVAADSDFHHRYAEIMLRPLSEAESQELLDRLLDKPALPDRLRASILERSGGNPFFIEEVVRTLIESGVIVPAERTTGEGPPRYWRATSDGADFAIPDNLQSLLAARMDRLEEGTRATLQIASVIGRSFFRRVLQFVEQAGEDLDQHLQALIRLEMIRESARVPELEYAFRNPLTQEAVYQTILLRRRREFHRRVGEAMEALFPNRLEGLSGLLAFHFAQAGEGDRAIEYYRLAARQSVGVYAYEDAIQSLRRALELQVPGEAPERHRDLVEELADVSRLVRDFDAAVQLYRQALDLASGTTDHDQVAWVRLHRKIILVATEAKWAVDAAAYQQVSAIGAESVRTLEQNIESMQDQPAHRETVALLSTLSMDAWRNRIPPDWAAAQRLATIAVDKAEQLDDPVVMSQALGAMASVLDGQSLLREQLQFAMRRLDIHRHGDLDLRENTDALRGAGAALIGVGEYEQALPYLQQSESLATRVRAADLMMNAIGLQAICLFRQDRWDQVLELEEKWRELERRYTRQRLGET